MYSDLDALTAILLWLFAALAVFELVLALRGRQVEAECGLQARPLRVAVSAVVAVLVVGVTLWATGLRLIGRSSAEAVTARASDPAGQKTGAGDEPSTNPELVTLDRQLSEIDTQLAEIKEKRKSLDAQRNTVRQRLRSSRDGGSIFADSASVASVTPRNFASLAILLVPALAIGGAVLLVLLGDPRTLVPRLGSSLQTERRLKNTGLFEKLVNDLRAERYGDALHRAQQVDERALDHFDALDFRYFKSFAAIEVAAVERPTADVNREKDFDKQQLLASSIADLESLLEEAPNRSEAAYLLALGLAASGRYDDALLQYQKCAADLKQQDLPIDHNQSVCLMRLAEKALSNGDIATADKHFSEVSRLGVLANQVPTSWVKIRFQNVRQNLRAGNFVQAQQELDAIRKIERLTPEQQRNVELTCAAFETLIPVRQQDDRGADRRIEAFLRAYVPAELWETSDEIVDEHLESAVDRQELPLSRQVYRSLLFTLAATKARLLATGSPKAAGRQFAAAEIEAIAAPLRCAMQFQLRSREVLAAIGGLSYFFFKERRPKALEWIRSAIDMGTQSRVARRILEHDRQQESQQRQALDWFRSKSARFLRDPTLKRQVRQTLVEELGRFQEFQPLLLDLDDVEMAEPGEPTVALLRDRARYLTALAAQLAAQRRPEDIARLESLRSEYARIVGILESTTTQLSALEKDLVAEVGKTVLS